MPTIIPTAIHDGYYTVSIGYEHRTFRIHTNGADSNFAPGKQIIAFLGRGGEYINFAFVAGDRLFPWKRFQVGYSTMIEAANFLIRPGSHQEASGKYYAQTSGNCYICNRMLTTPESIAAGIGPTCAGRL